MRKILLFFIGVFVAVHGTACAVVINKAPTVATKKVTAQEAGASLLPTALGVVSGVMQLTQQQKALSEECVPTGQELSFVNDIIKEWAKTGAATAEEIEGGRMNGMKRCADGNTYDSSIRMSADLNDSTLICYDAYTDDKSAVWYRYPKASSSYYCTDGSTNCSDKTKQHMSNIYDVFNLVDFGQDDYTVKEGEMAAKLMAKIEQCSSARLSARKKELWGNFLVGTIGGMGQKTNTANIMDTVSGMAGSMSGGGNVLQSLGGLTNMVPQLLNK